MNNLDTGRLRDFYQVLYPNRVEKLLKIWTWLNRPHFCGNNAPLLLIDKDRVIAHGGRIPFYLQLGSHRLLASWFIDFAVLPAFQGKGLGKKLTQEWMKFGDLHLAIGGYENSFSLFKKLGWVESKETHLLYFLVRPFDHPKLSRYLPRFAAAFLNRCGHIFLKRRYAKFSKITPPLCWQSLDEKNLAHFGTLQQNSENVAEPFRDPEYLHWRLLSSPDREHYFVVSLGDPSNGAVLVKKRDDKMAPFLDILWVSKKPESFDFAGLMAALGKWCCLYSFAYIRYYTTNEKNVELLEPLRPVVRHPRFAFFAKDPELFETLKKCRWHWELIDSDFEFV